MRQHERALQGLRRPAAAAWCEPAGAGGSGAADGARAAPPARADDAAPPARDWVAHLRRIHEARDHAAFAELFAYFAPRVKAFLMKGGADAATAEECAQDVMATLWRKAHLFDPARATVATWIFTIARNRRIDIVRRERRPEPEPDTLAPAPELEPDEAMMRRQEGDRLRAAMLALPEKQRDLVRLAFFADLSHSEIAQATGLPLGTIKSRIRLALERLRHEIRHHETQ